MLVSSAELTRSPHATLSSPRRTPFSPQIHGGRGRNVAHRVSLVYIDDVGPLDGLLQSSVCRNSKSDFAYFDSPPCLFFPNVFSPITSKSKIRAIRPISLVKRPPGRRARWIDGRRPLLGRFRWLSAARRPIFDRTNFWKCSVFRCGVGFLFPRLLMHVLLSSQTH